MVRNCCIVGCKSEAFKDCGISFHSFPKDEKRRNEWLSIIETAGHSLNSKNPALCSKHFKKEDFKTTTKITRLNDDAIPSLQLIAPPKRINVLSTIQTVTYTSPKEEELKRKMKSLREKLRRRDCKVLNLQSLLITIKSRCKKNYHEVENVITGSFYNIAKQFNYDKSNKGIRYSDELKQFALTLHYYSAPAYRLLRNRIALPHPATLRKILSTVDCNVGFMKESV